MRRTAAIVLCCLILCGCSRNNPIPAISEQTTEFPLEPIRTDQALTAYRLPESDRYSLGYLGKQLIVVSLQQNFLRITALTSDTLTPTAAYSLKDLPEPFKESVSVRPNDITIYLSDAKQLVILNSFLSEMGRISLPDCIRGIPILSADSGTVYFSTADAICAYDTDDSTVRVIVESPDAAPELLSSCADDTLLLCKFRSGLGQERYTLLSAEDGQTHFSENNVLSACPGTEMLCLSEQGTASDSILFGRINAMQEFIPPIGSRLQAWLPAKPALLMTENGGINLCNLKTGRIEARLPVPKGETVLDAACTTDGNIILLAADTNGAYYLERWNPAESPAKDDRMYSGPHFTRSSPDRTGLAECSKLASEIEQQYHVRVLFNTAAIADLPQEFALEPEHRVPLIREALFSLEKGLSHFPPLVFRQLGNEPDPVTICLVRSIEHKASEQFRDETHCQIVLSICTQLEENLYHELSHLIDTKVISTCNVFDDWVQLNPEDFTYTYDSDAFLPAANSIWLQDSSRYFIDARSMVSPSEDRAAILNCAITDGHEEYFSTEQMQEKLRKLCIGIRRTFGLVQERTIFPWEQYLWNSLSYR